MKRVFFRKVMIISLVWIGMAPVYDTHVLKAVRIFSGEYIPETDNSLIYHPFSLYD